MQPRQVVAWLLCAGLAGTSPLRANDADEPAPSAGLSAGQRVRFATTTIGLRYGTVLETDGDVLVLNLHNFDGTERVVRVPLSEVRSLEVAAGRRSRAGEGAIIGFIPGALVGGLLGGLSCGPDPEQPCDPYLGMALGAFFLGFIGSMVGGSIGATVKTDRWEKVGVPQTRLQIAPVPGGGLAVGLNVSF